MKAYEESRRGRPWAPSFPIMNEDLHTHETQAEAKAPHAPDVLATFESTAAPDWLVMPNHIINANNLLWLSKDDDRLYVKFKDGYSLNICVTDINKTWGTLQRVFADGVKRK